ncbi:SURF1 family protein [Herbidospora cretacea]|uniref:SURF1 family protein n=1 Tax=Herbidospora cretacea TaxID=28444 RepID=UPI0007746CEA|nr:SURF1 family protein [Herbidospora cretacea]
MLRTLFAPRLVGLHLLVIGVLVAFFLLGRWQLGVFTDSGHPQATDDPAPVALTELSRPGERVTTDEVGRQVTATGTYDATAQLLVADRRPDVDAPGGRASAGAGFWLLTPLTLADGSIMPVVRGWVASPGDPAVDVPAGEVNVVGRLRPPDQSDAVQRGGVLPTGQVATVSTAELLNLWDGDLRDGYVVATRQTPALSATPVAVPAPSVGAPLTWRNLAYAAQWWIFAVFAVYMWFHFVRDAVRSTDPEPQPET